MSKKIFCTAKLIKELGIEIEESSEIHENLGLGDWYSNVFLTNRKKHLVFSNTKTLLSFVVSNLKKKDFACFESLFLNGLEEILIDLDVESKVIDLILESYSSIEFDKTQSKTSIAHMNDAVQNCKILLSRLGESNLEIREINKKLNRRPLKALGWKFPIESLREQLILVINNKV